MGLRFGIGGYSFHGLLDAGKQDFFKYIEDSKALGASQLEPWNAQLAPIRKGDDAVREGKDPKAAELSTEDRAYLGKVRDAAHAAGLPFGCLAVDGAHIYEPTAEARAANRRIAERWLKAAQILGVPQVRIDCGGPEQPGIPDDVLAIIVAGYSDLIPKARALGIEVVIENHWGPSKFPENVVRLLNANAGLGLLFDTGNWAPDVHEKGWELCARFARATHIKTFRFDADGNEASYNIAKAVRLVIEAGYEGSWGIESCPEDGDEYGAVRKTMALIERSVRAARGA